MGSQADKSLLNLPLTHLITTLAPVTTSAGSKYNWLGNCASAHLVMHNGVAVAEGASLNILATQPHVISWTRNQYM